LRESRTPYGLLLDEMHSATLSAALRKRGHDVVAVVELPELRAPTDEEVFAGAAASRPSEQLQPLGHDVRLGVPT
jgi:Domain of unknown function (DUF5615)